MITQTENSLQRFKDRFEQAEESIPELEDMTVEMINSQEQKEKTLEKSEQSLMDLQDTIKEPNIRIAGVSQQEKGAERIFEEIMAENFSNLMKDMNINIQEAQ